MQQHGGAAVDEVMESPERRFYVSIQVDWDNDGSWDHPLSYLNDYVESVSVDRSLTGSAPSEIMLIEGSAAAEMTITIGGEVEGIPMPGVFSPYNTKSPLYGREIVGANLVFHIGVETRSGTFWYDQFRGNIRTVSPQRADATVEITALDRVEKLRKAVQLPPWAASEEHILHGELDSQLTRSQWVIENCLRMCDTGAGRKRPAYRWELWGDPLDNEGPQFFLSGNGSYLPTIGWVDNINASSFPNSGEPMYVQAGPVHPDAPAGAPKTLAIAGTGLPLENNAPDWSPGDFEGILRYWAADRDGIYPTATHYFGLTVNTDEFQTIGYHTALEVMVGFGSAIHIDIEEGRVRTRYHNHRSQDSASGSWIDIPTGQDHVDIFAMWDFTDPDQYTGVRCYIEAGDTNTGWEDQSNEQPGFGQVDQIAGRVTIGNALSVSDIFYANRNFYDANLNPDEAYRVPRYEAVLDPGKNQLSYVPSHKPREAWSIIKEVAAAEMGSVFWDETGVFRFWNMDTVLAKQQNIVRTLSLDHVSDLAITNSLDSVRNVYNAEVRKRRAVGGLVIYEGSDPNEFMVPARSTRHFRVWVEDALSPLTFFIPTYVSEEGHWQPYWTDNVTHGMCVQYLLNGVWQEDPTKEGLNNVNAYFAMDGSLNIRIQNLWYDDVRLASGLGENSRGALRIAGTKIVSGAAGTLTTHSPGSIEKYGARSMELSGDWWQDTVQSLGLIAELRRRTEAPIPTTDAIEIAGDPRLQLGDMLRLVDPNGLGDEVRVQILGINRSFDRDQGLRDSLTVEMVNPAGRPPVVTAMQDFVTDTTSTVVLTATWNVFNAPSYSAVWEIISGPAYVGDSLPDVGNGVTFQPAVEGVYVIQITVSTAFGDASDVVSVNSVAQDEDPPDDIMPANPGEALWIGPEAGKNHFNVGIGQPGGGGNHDDFSQEEIEDGFDDDPWFTLTENGDVQFRMNVEYGRTSERTKYPRSELREFKQDISGDDGRAEWDSGSGMHYMEATSRVMRVAPSGDKPEVCFFQVHDEDSDLARVITTDGGGGAEGLRLKLLWSPPGGDREEQEQIILSSYDLGQWVDWRMEFEDGTGRVYLDGDLVWEESDMGIGGCYFKTGCYNQVNNNDDGGNADEGDYCLVEIAKGSLITWHTGYAEPTNPDFSGGGDNEDDGARSFRFYLTNTAAENPTADVATWWNDSTAAASSRQLGTGPAGSTDSRVITETSTTSPYYAMLGRWISSPAPESGTLYADPWRVTMGVFENDSDADAYPFLTLWVTDGDTGVIKSGEAVISRVIESYEIPHDNNRASDFWATGDGAAGTGTGELAFAAGDRIVVDIGAQIENTSSDPYSVTAHYGGTSSTDLRNGDTDFNRPAWIDLRMLGGGFESSGGGISDDPDDGVQAAVEHGWGSPLAISDEFDYTGNVDESKWSLPGEYGEGWPGHNENGRRMPDRSTVADGKLVMTGLENGDTGWLRHRHDPQGGGRWEARVRSFMGAPSAGEPDDTSNGNTYNALLLIWPQDDGGGNLRERHGEYDFMELGDPGQDSMEAYIHYPHPGTSEVQQEHHELSGVDMSEWHNIALEYTRGDDGYVRGFVDGEMWFEDSGGANDVRRDIQDMPAGHLCIQLDNFHGDGMTPGTIEVQWVRVYSPPE